MLVVGCLFTITAVAKFVNRFPEPPGKGLTQIISLSMPKTGMIVLDTETAISDTKTLNSVSEGAVSKSRTVVSKSRTVVSESKATILDSETIVSNSDQVCINCMVCGTLSQVLS